MGGEGQDSSEIVEALVRDAAAGDGTAQQALLSRYHRFIMLAVRERLSPAVRGREETQDVAQEVALTVLRGLDGHEWRGRKAFIAWLRRIVVGETIDAHRFHQAARRRAAAEAGPSPLAQAVAAGRVPESWLDEQRRLRELEAMLQQLPPSQAQAILMNLWGHTHGEIGEVLGCSAEAARKQVSRGMRKLVDLRQQAGGSGQSET